MAPSPLLSLSLRLSLGGLSLALDGEVPGPVTIVGPSGAGKSTLLRVLAGVEARARGRLVVLGETWQEGARLVPAWRRGVGWAPQEPRLFPHRSVRDNLGWMGPPAPLLEEVAALLALGPLLDRRPRHLSGGEQQRVNLGRALCARPRLLLLDEPFAALDPPLRRRLRAGLAAFCAARSLPVVLVSHDAEDAELTAGAMLRVEGGRLRAPGDDRP